MTISLSILDQAPVPQGLTQSEALANTLDLARRVDVLGYRRYWLAEHHAMASHAISAPEIVVGAVAAATTAMRVGSGGVLLGHYSAFKVAEVFRTLSALYPGRIDLGIGRSSGAGEVETWALNPAPGAIGPTVDTKVATLRDLLANRLPPTHPLVSARATPTDAVAPELWLLGSSPSSAAAAAALGVDYAYAHFINPRDTAEAVRTYRERYAEGRIIVAISALVAGTDDQAQHLFATQRAVRNRILRNDASPIPRPSEALEELAAGGDVLASERFRWPRYLAGTPAAVAGTIRDLAETLDVEEFIVVTTVHDHQARVHSYELLAQEFALQDPAVRAGAS